MSSNRNTFEGVDACDVSLFESIETLKTNSPLGASLSRDIFQTSSKNPMIVVIVPAKGPSKLIAEARKIQEEGLKQMTNTARLYLNTFQRRSEIWSQIKDIEVRQKKKTDQTIPILSVFDLTSGSYPKTSKWR
jgi:hypothetical protein